mmetsp:Transcript_31384/g.66454  ORF Transcript_31384/g.66454 Transcript_31384/m.66454 type:complete len:344 (-) Transcript_31384:339-1370(-)
MKRHTNANGDKRNEHGERQLSAAARAAMARAAGVSNADSVPRSPTSFATRKKRKLRSICYRMIYGSVITGNPTQQSNKARNVFWGSLLGVMVFLYIPSMALGYFLTKYAFAKSSAGGVDMTQLKTLEHQSFSHGKFFFGQTSHASGNPIQQKNLRDAGTNNVEVQKETCKKYDLGFPPENVPHSKRRLFLGCLLADESMEELHAVSTEAYNIFHTVSYIESKIVRLHRDWKYGLQSESLRKLQQSFGPQTKVSVDYYLRDLNTTTTTTTDDLGTNNELLREGNYLRWKMNGMTKDDVAIVADANTTFSKDFLKALQVCELPEFQPGTTSCNETNVSGFTLKIC